jgi:hypothetical protein
MLLFMFQFSVRSPIPSYFPLGRKAQSESLQLPTPVSYQPLGRMFVLPFWWDLEVVIKKWGKPVTLGLSLPGFNFLVCLTVGKWNRKYGKCLASTLWSAGSRPTALGPW